MNYYSIAWNECNGEPKKYYKFYRIPHTDEIIKFSPAISNYSK